jgi:hypothetical protein
MEQAEAAPNSHWREIIRSTDFYRDILVTILGVLIALGIGEIAQSLDWRSRARDATAAIDIELANNAATFEERSLLQPCIERRLAELDRIYATARTERKLPDIGSFGATPYRGLETAAWDDAVGNGALGHMLPRQKTRLASVYPTIASYNSFVLEEQTLWYRLQLIQHAPGPISEPMLAEIGATLKVLTYRARLNGLLANQLLQFTRDRGIAADLRIFGDQATSRSLAADVAQRSICRPLSVR